MTTTSVKQKNETSSAPVDGNEGMVFNIQRFSLQDGPGIRTTVFLKGCPLRCKWCSNPESQNLSFELMFRRRNCQACGTCAEVCQTGAIQFEEGAPRLDRALCTVCNDCVNACPGNALEVSGMKMSMAEVFDEVIRDIPFYNNSGGGVTVSGGEPLFQPAFTNNLLKISKEKGLHTCLDTSGYASWETLNRIIDYTDLVLYDVKQFDDKLHLKETKVSNELILDNLRKLIDSGKTKVWIRVPVISGFSDMNAFYQEMAESLPGSVVEKVSLLGYHEWGKTKYDALGRVYPLEGLATCSKEKLESIKNYLEKQGINVTIDH